MKPVVIVAGRRAEHNPDRNRLTIQFLFPKQNGAKGDAGEIILINGDVPQIIVKEPEAVLVETESREGCGSK
jgi:hypothetical protein